MPTCINQNCEGASTGTLQSRALPDLSGNRGSKYMGDVVLLGFTDNADIIGDIPHTAAIEPALELHSLSHFIVVTLSFYRIFIKICHIKKLQFNIFFQFPQFLIA